MAKQARSTFSTCSPAFSTAWTVSMIASLGAATSSPRTVSFQHGLLDGEGQHVADLVRQRAAHVLRRQVRHLDLAHDDLLMGDPEPDRLGAETLARPEFAHRGRHRTRVLHHTVLGRTVGQRGLGERVDQQALVRAGHLDGADRGGSDVETDAHWCCHHRLLRRCFVRMRFISCRPRC
jgi:hypothetical protein